MNLDEGYNIYFANGDLPIVTLAWVLNLTFEREQS